MPKKLRPENGKECAHGRAYSAVRRVQEVLSAKENPEAEAACAPEETVAATARQEGNGEMKIKWRNQAPSRTHPRAG